MPHNIFIWEQIDHTSVRKRIHVLTEEVYQQIKSHQLLLDYRGDVKMRPKFDDVLRQLADNCVGSVYEIYRASTSHAEDADFKETVWEYGVQLFIEGRPNRRDIPELLRSAFAHHPASPGLEFATDSRIRRLTEGLSRKWKNILAPFAGYSAEYMAAVRAMSEYEIEHGNIIIPPPQPKKPDSPTAKESNPNGLIGTGTPEGSPLKLTNGDDLKYSKKRPLSVGELKARKGTDCSAYFDQANLTEQQRSCESLRSEYKLNTSEIARQLKLSRKTVDGHLEAAEKKMRAADSREKAKKQQARRPL